MKIAITVSGATLDAPLDKRFGRAAGFLIYDLESNQFEIMENQQNLNAPQGAGIQAAQNVVQAGVQCVITGHCGPKAFHVLQEAGIKIYPCQAATAGEALQLFRSNKLEVAEKADVKGHWL